MTSAEAPAGSNPAGAHPGPYPDHPKETHMTTAIDRSPKPTPEEAAAAHLTGWNLRCNSCGLYGATWIPKMRPGWGALALCYPHEQELYAMQNRHADELRTLTTVNFEQPR